MNNYITKQQLMASIRFRMLNASQEEWIDLAKLLAELEGWIESNRV